MGRECYFRFALSWLSLEGEKMLHQQSGNCVVNSSCDLFPFESSIIYVFDDFVHFIRVFMSWLSSLYYIPLLFKQLSSPWWWSAFIIVRAGLCLHLCSLCSPCMWIGIYLFYQFSQRTSFAVIDFSLLVYISLISFFLFTLGLLCSYFCSLPFFFKFSFLMWEQNSLMCILDGLVLVLRPPEY